MKSPQTKKSARRIPKGKPKAEAKLIMSVPEIAERVANALKESKDPLTVRELFLRINHTPAADDPQPTYRVSQAVQHLLKRGWLDRSGGGRATTYQLNGSFQGLNGERGPGVARLTRAVMIPVPKPVLKLLVKAALESSALETQRAAMKVVGLLI